jgi:diketogulonate reductase-like aldo/keto reductase
MQSVSRRTVLGAAAALGTLAAIGPARATAPLLAKPIGATLAGRDKETLPVIGLGSWITFNVGRDAEGRARSAEVMRNFFQLGGRVIDSSPMYGSAQAVIGEALKALGEPKELYSATKVWIAEGPAGPKQIEESRSLWGVPRFDLLQVHNLLSWQKHLETLKAMKAEGRVRHIGITTSHGMRHAEMEKVMLAEPIDFVQLTYNLLDREVEQRLLPLAQEKGIAVLANRPFRQGQLIEAFQGRKLPDWALAEFDVTTWPQFLLKFAVSHPAVTCAIPATSSIEHVRENMVACYGRMPDAALRKRMAELARSV